MSRQFYAIGRVTVSIYAANVNASLCQVEYNTFFTLWAVGKNAVIMRPKSHFGVFYTPLKGT